MDAERAELVRKWPSLGKGMEDDTESHDGREERLISYLKSRPDHEQFKGAPQKLIVAIDEYSAKEDFLISVGGHKANVLTELILKEKPKTIVELGGYLGYSAIVFADALRRASPLGQKLHIWSLEMDSKCAAMARELIELTGCSDIVTVVEGGAEQSLRKMNAEGTLTQLDMLFLDHVEDLYVADFKVCEELGLLKEGVVIVADNVVRPGAPEYRKFAREHPRLTSTGVRGLIQPGNFEDELEVSYVVKGEK